MDLCVNDCKTLLNFIINDLLAVTFVLSLFLRPSCVTTNWGRTQLQGGTEDPGELLSFPGQIRAVLHIQATRPLNKQVSGVNRSQAPCLCLLDVSKVAFALSEPGSLFVLISGMSLRTEGLGEEGEVVGAYISCSAWQLCTALRCQHWAQPHFIVLYSDHAEWCSWHQLEAVGWREQCRMQPKAACPHLPLQKVQSDRQRTESTTSLLHLLCQIVWLLLFFYHSTIKGF